VEGPSISAYAHVVWQVFSTKNQTARYVRTLWVSWAEVMTCQIRLTAMS